MDLNTAIQVVMKKALAHDGLARGLHESARAIERGMARGGSCSSTFSDAPARAA
jgi:hypothetical protein